MKLTITLTQEQHSIIRDAAKIRELNMSTLVRSEILPRAREIISRDRLRRMAERISDAED